MTQRGIHLKGSALQYPAGATATTATHSTGSPTTDDQVVHIEALAEAEVSVGGEDIGNLGVA
jgi:hypothetical protein